MKKPVKFIVTREYSGSVPMEKMFESVLEDHIRKKYSLLKTQKRVEIEKEAC